MKKLIVLTTAAAAAWMYTQTSKTGEPVIATNDTVPHEPAAVIEPPANTESVAKRAPAAADTSDSLERRSLSELTDTVAASVNPHAPFQSLIERLQKSGQSPRVIRDANPDSGEMLIVRTDAPLSGTRYFHAQYFTDESGERFAQHISFEFKPGPGAMNDAIAAVEKSFSGLSARTHDRADYVRWKLGDDRIVWIKKLNMADLQDDPFNAYTKDDVGAVRVAVEQDPHADGHDD